MPRKNAPARSTNRIRPLPSAATQPPLVSAHWLAASIAATIVGAAICAWAALCLLFWQGSWQLLYHPSASITRTPASAGLAFEHIAFDPDSSGQPQLTAWWIPQNPPSQRTALYLHGADGNLSSTVDLLTHLHAANLNVFAIDYRGYGQSHRAHPSEAGLLRDADAAIAYLTATRHIPAASIVLIGSGLGANLALGVASAHSELAGVVLDQPLADPMRSVFGDARARFVPAHVLVRDRYNLSAAAPNLNIPVLWLQTQQTSAAHPQPDPAAYAQITARKMLVSLPAKPSASQAMDVALSRWLDELGH